MKTNGVRNKMLPIILVALIAMLLVLSINMMATPVHAALTPHAPISIIGDNQFDVAHGVNGGGNGNPGSPYIIENYAIDLTSQGVDGITIKNTTKYFIVRNCLIENGGRDYGGNYGINLDNVGNGNVKNCTIDNNYFGIYTTNHCSNDNFDNNTLYGNGWGMYIYIYTANSTVSNNKCCYNSSDGIFLQNVENNTIVNNTCNNNNLYGIETAAYCKTNIFDNNTCNNENRSGIMIKDTYTYYSQILTNNTCDNDNWDGIYLNGLSAARTIVIGNTCDNNNLNGIRIYNSAYDNIENNTITNNHQYGIMIYYSSFRNLIYHNYIANNGTQAYDNDYAGDDWRDNWDNGYPSGGNYWSDYAGSDANHDGIGDTPYSISGGSNKDNYPLMLRPPFYINGDDNFTAGNGVVAGSGTMIDPYIIENYTINASAANGIDIENTTAYFIVRNCLVENGGGSYDGIYLDNVTNGTLENLTVDNNRNGINLVSSPNNTISNNIVKNNNQNGIILDPSNNNLIENNILENNQWDCIQIYNSDNNIIENNIVENSKNYHGIDLWYNSDNNTVFGNTCSNNYYFGIYLQYYSDNNTISGNTCSNNMYGIYPYQSSNNNMIFHNFINDGARDSCTNYWDNGYPSGGNYWSDYTGADHYRGVSQNIPGGDGIGDTPRTILGGGNIDHYPLVQGGVDVWISPSYQVGAPDDILAYTVTVFNSESVPDSYNLTKSDNAGWGDNITLDDIVLGPIPSLDNRTTTLHVHIPQNAIIPTNDNITITATSQGNVNIKENMSCIARAWETPWEGTATSKLENLYKVSENMNLQLYAGSKLVVKFYDYSSAFESEVVIDSITPPQTVAENENVPHPPTGSGPVANAVKTAVLVLTDDTGNIISTIASFTVQQTQLRGRITAILKVWGGQPEQQNGFRAELTNILKQWGSAPS